MNGAGFDRSVAVKRLPRTLGLALVACLLAAQTAWSATATELNAYANETLKKLYDDSPAAKELSAHARAVLVFPRVWKGGIGIGAEGGEGVLRVGGKSVDYYQLAGGSFGFQLGLQRKSIVIMFMEPAALKKFRDSEGWKAGVDGSVAIASLGAGASVDTETGKKPIVGFVTSNKGLMYNLSLEGTKITRVKK
jgi:lipid-binding SYLF domain-containing protein